MQTRSGRAATGPIAASLEERSSVDDDSLSPTRSRAKKRKFDNDDAPSADDILSIEPPFDDSPAKHTRKSRTDSSKEVSNQKSHVKSPVVVSSGRSSPSKKISKKEISAVDESKVLLAEKNGVAILASELDIDSQRSNDNTVNNQIQDESSSHLAPPAVIFDTGLEAEESDEDAFDAANFSPRPRNERLKDGRSQRERQVSSTSNQMNEDEEVENYPCKLCQPHRIFLTSFGLERHTKMSHPDQLNEVMDEVRRLQEERGRRAEARRPKVGPGINSAGWENRRQALERLSRLRNEDNNRLVRKYGQKGKENDQPETEEDEQASSPEPQRKEPESEEGSELSDGEPIRPLKFARRQRKIFRRANFTRKPRTGGARNRTARGAPRAKYQSCDICGILINTEHPRAMESHAKAHEKNDELRQELLKQFGPHWVDNVTCRECNLVFRDEEKLEQHRRNVHIRRRHFLCRFCGDVFRTMRDLNLHKEKRHDAFEGHRRHPDTVELAGYARRLFNSVDQIQQGGLDSPSSLANLDAAPNITGEEGGGTDNNGLGVVYSGGRRVPLGLGDAGVAEEFTCRTVCEVCHLQMVRPSNLVRHMKTVHNRSNFTATVETKGMPPFRIDAYKNLIFWGCCDEVYEDRRAFVAHRKTAHGPQAYAGAPRECEYCGMLFRNDLLFINHFRTHRPRVCRFCGQQFGASSAVDVSLYRAHMHAHLEQGFDVNMPRLTQDIAKVGRDPQGDVVTRIRELEIAEQDDELDDLKYDQDHGDTCSVFSESGVESECDDNVSNCDKNDYANLVTSCPVCDKKFNCVYRFGDHYTLHCRPHNLKFSKLKTKPYSYRKPPRRFRCPDCRIRFVRLANFALHRVRCKKRRFGRYLDEVERSQRELFCETPEQAKMKADKRNLSPEKKQIVQTVKPVDSSEKPKTFIVKPLSKNTSKILALDAELEDSLDVPGLNAKCAWLPEKAYIVEWDTTSGAVFGQMAGSQAKKSNQNKPPYQCLTCKEQLSDFLALMKHMNTHIGKDDEKLTRQIRGKGKVPEKVKKGAGDADTLRAFVLAIRTGPLITQGRHACRICHQRFDTLGLLEEHEHLSHSTKRQLCCDSCGQTFWTAKALRRHLKRHDLSLFYCTSCDKRFTSYETLTKHQTVHELTYSVYQCEDCVQSLYGLAQLKSHFRSNHPGVNIVSCPVCARIHTDAQGLEEHFHQEHSKTKSRCKICGKYFSTPMKTLQHVRRAHRARKFPRASQCDLCGKWLPDEFKQAMHGWHHKNGLHAQCAVCCRAERDDESVRRHLEQCHQIHWVNSRDLIVYSRPVLR